jgi:glycosyltransferase involved in cell wall biosynthesis
MKTHQSLISVVISVKNGAGSLQRSIDSFAIQTYPGKELVIIDGGSTDGTIDIIRNNRDAVSYWESETDRGITHAWNKALKYTKGDWIIFLGSDDVLHDPDVLSEFSQKTHAFPGDQRIFYGMVNLITGNGEIIDTPGWDWQEIRAVFFSEKMMIPHQACFHHRSVFQDYGLFDEQFAIVADYELLLRILKKEKPVFLPSLIVSDMSFGGLSSQVKSLFQMQYECDRALLKNGFKPRGYKRVGNIIVYRLMNLVINSAGEKTAGFILDKIRFLLGKKPVWTRK